MADLDDRTVAIPAVLMGLLGASLLTSYRHTRDFSAGGQTPRALRALQKAKSGGRSSEQSILNQGRVSLSQCNSWRPWRVRFGSCVTSIARPYGGAQLYER